MMAGGVGGEERRDGGNRCRTAATVVLLPQPRELDLLLSKYVLFHMYLLKAVTGLGYLALTWSTVVLLGGFVTALTKKDFWCITVISLIQAARIFHDLADQLLPNFFKLVTHIIRHNYDVLRHRMWHVIESFRDKYPLATVAARVASVAFVGLAVLPFLVMCYVPTFLYVYGGPIACIALAVWRTAQCDYAGAGGDGGGDNSNANLAPALDMFYSLVLLQAGLLLVWLYHESLWVDHLITLRQQCRLPNTGWCRLSLVEFLCDTRARCWRDLSSIRGRRVVDYAASLLDSGSLDDNLSAARLLDEFIRQQGSSESESEPTTVSVRSLLLASRPKIQKLIDALGWRDSGRRPGDAEMRKLAAGIVAHLASDLHLSQFPGAIQCISYLLLDETTLLAYSDQQEGLTHRRPHSRRLPSEKQAMILRLEDREARRREKHMKRRRDDAEAADSGGSSGGGGGGGACNELILHGLAILERLASDHHNCGEICRSPGLLAKITAPLYSGTVVHDIHIHQVIDDWVQVVNGTFKVLYQLILHDAPGESSTSLRSEIAENKQAVSNLMAIIRHQDAHHQELQMRAMEILTELALDSSIDLHRETKKTLMKLQMDIFLDTAQGEDLRATAGRTLALTKCGDEIFFDPLVPILDDENITYRMIAAEILENMCAHCGKRLKDILLPKILSELLSSERENTQSEHSAPRNNIDENKRIPRTGQDEENPNISPSSRQGNEERTATKAWQAKLLSLIMVMYVNKLETADFGNALANNGSAFVAKLKTIVVENCQATVGSLSIVKLCGQIAVSMMRHGQCTEHFKNKEFVKSLSEARKIMSGLESCVLFAGRDHGLRKMARPLLLDLENETQMLVG